MPMSNAGGASHEGAFTGLLADEVVNFPVTASTTVFDGAIWNVQRETFEFAGANVTREFIDHTGAVAVLAIDEHDRVCVITQYRHPIRAIEWELPAGLLDFAGEPALSAAKRELAEEVDLEASDWAVLLDFQVSPGGSNEALRVYLARGVSETAEIFERTNSGCHSTTSSPPCSLAQSKTPSSPCRCSPQTRVGHAGGRALHPPRNRG
jgi:hypothetical protein